MRPTSWAGTDRRLYGPHRRLVVPGKSRADLPILFLPTLSPPPIKDLSGPWFNKCGLPLTPFFTFRSPVAFCKASRI